MKKFYLVIAVALAFSYGLTAQDVHFTQQFDNPVYLNPAHSGMGKKANRLVLQYRDQWRTVPVPFASAFASYDRRLFKTESQSLGAGLQLVYDRAGDGGLSTVKASISPSYTRYFKEESLWLSVGIQVGMYHRFVNTSDLVFESQYDGVNVNDNSGEALGGNATAADLGLGVHLGSKIGEKDHRVEGGFSVYNIHKPDLAFIENATDERPVRYNAYVSTEIFLGDNGWSLNPVFQYQRQEKLDNILPILYAKKYVKTDNRDMAFSFGGGYRVDDAAAMYFAYEVGDFKLGLSYDVNTSSFNDATNTVGAGEILLKYEFERKKKEVVIEVEIDSVFEDTVVVAEPEPVEPVEMEPVVPEPVKPEPIKPVPTLIEQINAGISLNLFFPNDYPDPRTLATTTSMSYGEVYEKYMQLAPDYISQGGEEGGMGDFIEDELTAEWERYNQLMRDIRLALAEGKQVTVEIRGYTSPIASASYNEKLARRRIMSVMNQFRTKEDIGRYFEEGRIVIIENPLGESQAPAGISDDRNDMKNSVYSSRAAFERRVEIERVTIE